MKCTKYQKKMNYLMKAYSKLHSGTNIIVGNQSIQDGETMLAENMDSTR